MQYFWGNVPEYDLLNLPNNEGTDYDKDLQICFAGRFDLAFYASPSLTFFPSFWGP
jgi:hypothetical protein